MTIQFIMDNFDFEKVHAYMVKTNWTYGGETVPPSMEVIKKVAYDLLVKVVSRPEDHSYISTGGFWVVKWNDFLNLHFAIEDL